MTPMRLAECMSHNPAKVLGMADEIGHLAKGAMADIVITEPNEAYVIQPEDFFTKGRNTPFGGKQVYGRVYVTICGGTVTYER